MLWDGLIETVYTDCEDKNNIPLNIQKYYSKLTQIENKKTLKKIRESLYFAFTEKDINYINSKFLDELIYVFITKKDLNYFTFYSRKMCEFLLKKNLNIDLNIIEAAKHKDTFCVKTMLEMCEIADNIKISIFKAVCNTDNVELLEFLLENSTLNLRNEYLRIFCSNYNDRKLPLVKVIFLYGVSVKPIFFKSVLIGTFVIQKFENLI